MRIWRPVPTKVRCAIAANWENKHERPQPQASDYLRKILLSPVYEVAKVTPVTDAEKDLRSSSATTWRSSAKTLQPVHSFKLRGAYNKIAGLTEAHARKASLPPQPVIMRRRGAIGAKLKIPAIIVMPTTTPDIKIDAVRRMGR